MKRSDFEQLKFETIRSDGVLGWTAVSADNDVFAEQGETNSRIKEKRQGKFPIHLMWSAAG